MDELKIGVVGYSHERFDHELARALIRTAYDRVLCAYPTSEAVAVVSGFTNLGIPALAYEEAKSRNWRTVGIACKKGKNYDLFPVDEGIFVGDKWGDESPTFFAACDTLIRIGGGEQSHTETIQFRREGGSVFEFELLDHPAE